MFHCIVDSHMIPEWIISMSMQPGMQPVIKHDYYIRFSDIGIRDAVANVLQRRTLLRWRMEGASFGNITHLNPFVPLFSTNERLPLYIYPIHPPRISFVFFDFFLLFGYLAWRHVKYSQNTAAYWSQLERWWLQHHVSNLGFPGYEFDNEISEHPRSQEGRKDVQFDAGAEEVAVGESDDEPQGFEQPIVGECGFRFVWEEDAIQGWIHEIKHCWNQSIDTPSMIWGTINDLIRKLIISYTSAVWLMSDIYKPLLNGSIKYTFEIFKKVGYSEVNPSDSCNVLHDARL